MSRKPGTVFFDMGNTLLDFHQGQTDEAKDDLGLRALTRFLARYDERIDLEAVRRDFFSRWAECFPKRLQTLLEYPVEDYVNEFLRPFGVSLERSEIVEALDAFHCAYRAQLAWEPGLELTLSSLREKGLKIGVISNSYLFHEINVRHFQHAGLDELIDSYTFSYSLRLRKPTQEIFLEALRRADTVPARALMVGDSLKADIEGAQRVGMQAVWFNPAGRKNDTDVRPDFEVRRLAEVATLVWSPLHRPAIMPGSADRGRGSRKRP